MRAEIDCNFHDLVYDIVNPEKKCLRQEALRAVNWTQTHNQSGVGAADRAQHCREKPGTELSASCTVLLLSESTTVREFLVSSFHQWSETCPIQSEPHDYILICISANQLELLHDDQS